MRPGNLQPERIEPRLQMAAHPVGADQHQRAQRGDGGRADLLAGQRCRRLPWGTRCTGRSTRRLGDDGTHLILELRVARRPGGAGRVLQHRARIVVQRAEQLGEGGVHRGGIGRPARILFAQERRVRATERRCQDVNASHQSGFLVSSGRIGIWACSRDRDGCEQGALGCYPAHGLYRAYMSYIGAARNLVNCDQGERLLTTQRNPAKWLVPNRWPLRHIGPCRLSAPVVIPAKAGTQSPRWVPAFAGMTTGSRGQGSRG